MDLMHIGPEVLARRALLSWGVRHGDITLLRARENTTFAVCVEGARRYVLRVCPPSARRARVEREIAWLRAIRRDTDVAVTAPFAMYDDEKTGRICVAFYWRHGEPLTAKTVTMTDLRQIGSLMAKLHRHAWGWTRRGAVARRPSERSRREDRGAAARCFHRDELAVLSAAEAICRPAIATLRRSPRFGIIHGDITPENCVAHDGTVALIDFGDARDGFFLRDIARTLASLWTRPDSCSLRAAFLAGYRDVGAVTAEETIVVERLTVGSLAAHVRWLACHAEEPGFAVDGLDRARKMIAEIDRRVGQFEGRG